MTTDLQVITQMYYESQAECAALRADLSTAREHARNWENTAKSLRKEIQRLRMEKDTERIVK